MSKFQAGQKVRVIGDSFKADPHNLPVGSVFVVESISPATPFKEFPPLMQLMFAMKGIKPYDLPERVHVKTGDNPFQDFANIVFEDLEMVEDYSGKRVRMLEDDWAEGYGVGDVFEVHVDSEEQAYFIDKDGDVRLLADHEHEII
ncbi:hypothetical protein ABES03_08520 [Neobacillus rhizosphaerae]|uniref:hypothetical protein n=1 Tax=Neobacillus rhizosphaerae TaxID=2880965 RepID=UPI003D26E688